MNEPLNICFVAFNFSPIIGGAETRAEKEARQLQALGHTVTIVTLRHDRQWEKKEKLQGLTVVRVGGMYNAHGKLRTGRIGHLPIDIALFLTLLQLRGIYDIIFACQVSPLAAVAALIGKLFRKPVVISIQAAGTIQTLSPQLKGGTTLMKDTLTTIDLPEIHSKDLVTDDISYLTRSALGGHILLNFLRHSNAFYRILSTRSRSHLISAGFPKGQIIHIPGSVDTEKFRPASDGRPDPAKPERNLICVARLDYSKGIDVLLHAWGRMMNMAPEWRTYLKPKLLLVGEGAMKPHLERISTELEINTSVEFLGLQRNILELLQQAWGFVLPSRMEGMPNALLEAMACGLPCVATRVSGSEDIISNGINGLLVEPEQPAEMAQALRRIIENSDLAQQLGEEARTTVVRDYQLSNIVEQCVEFYRRLLDMNKAGAVQKKHRQGPSYEQPAQFTLRGED